MANALAPDQELPLRPVSEQAIVTFFDLPCLAVRADDSTIYLAVRDLCDAIGVNRQSQLRRLRNHTLYRPQLARFSVMTSGGTQEQVCLHLTSVGAWLLSLNTSRVSPHIQQRLLHLQQYLQNAVYEAFARAAGLPEQSTSAIEDLDDLAQFDTAIRAIHEHIQARDGELAERITSTEQSQDRARDAWREMRIDIKDVLGRLQALEQKVGGTITKAQRGVVYQCVNQWADARSAADPRLTPGAARQACWAVFKRRFDLAKYEDLPSAKYTTALTFLKEAYHQVAGKELHIPEQNEMEL